jgi:hypothetical protein
MRLESIEGFGFSTAYQGLNRTYYAVSQVSGILGWSTSTPSMSSSLSHCIPHQPESNDSFKEFRAADIHLQGKSIICKNSFEASDFRIQFQESLILAVDERAAGAAPQVQEWTREFQHLSRYDVNMTAGAIICGYPS